MSIPKMPRGRARVFQILREIEAEKAAQSKPKNTGGIAIALILCLLLILGLYRPH